MRRRFYVPIIVAMRHCEETVLLIWSTVLAEARVREGGHVVVVVYSSRLELQTVLSRKLKSRNLPLRKCFTTVDNECGRVCCLA